MSTPEGVPSADVTPAPPSADVPLSMAAAPPTTEAELREFAHKRLKKRQDFRAHAVVFVVVNASLWALWAVLSLTNGWTFPWPVFPTLGGASAWLSTPGTSVAARTSPRPTSSARWSGFAPSESVLGEDAQTGADPSP